MKNSLICIFLSVFSLMACTEADDLTFRDRDGVVVSFITPGMAAGEGEVGTRAGAYVKLDENTTVRILVYRRTGASANMAADTYIGENTYVADAYGALSACVVNTDGEVITGTATDLRLIQGEYDFYAITPALPVTKESADNTRKVSVKHGVDYATSLTEKGIVTTTSGAITLETLERKCSLLEFNFDRKSSNVSEVKIDEVSLTAMATAPLTEILAKNLPDAATSAAVIALGGSVFTNDATDKYKASGSTIVLPKPAGDITLGMKLKFNGLSTQVVLSPATVTGLALAKGTRYIFKVVLKGGSVKLTLTVADWNETYDIIADDLGASNSLTLEVGEWQNVNFNSSTGGSQEVITGDWAESKDWSDNLGKYPGLSSTIIGGTGIWGDAVDNDLNNGGDNPNDGWGGESNTNPGDIG